MHTTKHLKLPAFLPDATYLTINSVPFDRVLSILDGVVITTLHAYAKGVTEVTNELPLGFKDLANIKERIVLSDSGGFQVLSLIHNKKLGKITEDGALFKYPTTGEKILLTPEFSQQIQYWLKSDIRVVLDYPTMGSESKKELEYSVKITTQWAKRAKREFLKLENLTTKQFNNTRPKLTGITHTLKLLEFTRPLLVGVVQGGNDLSLRKKSAQELAKIGFDIYGFGGWPLININETRQLNVTLLEHFLKIIPPDAIPYAMGLGTPDDIYILTKMGYLLFDCVIPTRNARHGLLYVTKGTGEPKGETYDVLHIKTQNYKYDTSPIDPTCDCPVCQNAYPRGYIRFLLKTKNPVGYTLTSIHNVWWYLKFMQNLRETGTYPTKDFDNISKDNYSKTDNTIESENALDNGNNPAHEGTTKATPKTTNPTAGTSHVVANITTYATHSQESIRENRQNTNHTTPHFYIITDAGVSIKNAHIKGHSGTGEARCGYVILDTNQNILIHQSRHLGTMKIPQAELECVIRALKRFLKELPTLKSRYNLTKNTQINVHLYSDSQLIVNWLTGKYKVKQPHIKPLYKEFTRLQQDLLQNGVMLTIKWHRRNRKWAQVVDRLAHNN